MGCQGAKQLVSNAKGEQSNFVRVDAWCCTMAEFFFFMIDEVDLKLRTGNAIRKYSFPEAHTNSNLYAPFHNRIDYQLA